MVERRIKVIVNGKERKASEQYVFSSEKPVVIEQRSSSPSKIPRHSKKKLNQVWISAIFALGIGLTFGLIMLTLFTGEHSIIEQAQGKEKDNDLQKSEEADLNFAVTIIQGGAFQTSETANKIKDKILKDGYAAIVDKTEKPYRLYLGIGTKKEHLQTLLSEYDSYGQETYVKNLDIIPSETLTDTEKQLLVEGKDLLLAFIMDTERLLNGQNIDNRELLTKKMLAWKSKVENEWNGSEKIKDFVHILQETDRAIQAYMDDNKEKQLWTMENNVLQAFMLYKNLVNAN